MNTRRSFLSMLVAAPLAGLLACLRLRRNPTASPLGWLPGKTDPSIYWSGEWRRIVDWGIPLGKKRMGVRFDGVPGAFTMEGPEPL